MLPTMLPHPTMQVVMVNSSWTRGHVSRLWWTFTQPLLVYPPCNVSHLAALPLDRKLKSLFLVSLAQFRPEKDQAKQLRAFAMARQRAAAQVMHPDEDSSHAVLAARLKVVGSCRNREDKERVAQLVRMCPLCPSLMSAHVQACHLLPCVHDLLAATSRAGLSGCRRRGSAASWGWMHAWTFVSMRHSPKSSSFSEALWEACTPWSTSTLAYPSWSTWLQVDVLLVDSYLGMPCKWGFSGLAVLNLLFLIPCCICRGDPYCA